MIDGNQKFSTSIIPEIYNETYYEYFFKKGIKRQVGCLFKTLMADKTIDSKSVIK